MPDSLWTLAGLWSLVTGASCFLAVALGLIIPLSSPRSVAPLAATLSFIALEFYAHHYGLWVTVGVWVWRDRA